MAILLALVVALTAGLPHHGAAWPLHVTLVHPLDTVGGLGGGG